MPNRNYLKGCRLERKLVNKARDEEKLAYRSAGSHSPIDVTIINIKGRTIELLQCKKSKKKMSQNAKDKLIESQALLPGTYQVTFAVKTDSKDSKPLNSS